MKYDFTTLYDRRGMDAMAVDVIDHDPEYRPKEGFDPIPMWVADMNFATAPSVNEAIRNRTEHPLYGYYYPRDEYYDCICRWHAERNGVTGLTRQCVGYENGVLGGLLSALAAVCLPGDRVLVHSPTYIGFTFSMENAGYRLVHSPLLRDEKGVWRMDFPDMEEKLASGDIRAAVFCSPHNPTGRVWERSEIEQFMEMCRRHRVTVISDEIWSDLVLRGHKHIPTQSVSEDARERTIALYAPSKTFNLAGLVGSYHIIYNPALRDKVRRAGSLSHYNSMNVLSMYALMGGYSPEGAEWLEELKKVLSENVNLTCAFFREQAPDISIQPPQGTYMLFLDCTEYCRRRGITLDDLLRRGHEVGVLWQDGRPFLGKCHIRMNLALPKTRLEEALDRLEQYVLTKPGLEEAFDRLRRHLH